MEYTLKTLDEAIKTESIYIIKGEFSRLKKELQNLILQLSNDLESSNFNHDEKQIIQGKISAYKKVLGVQK